VEGDEGALGGVVEGVQVLLGGLAQEIAVREVQLADARGEGVGQVLGDGEGSLSRVIVRSWERRGEGADAFAASSPTRPSRLALRYRTATDGS